MTFEQAIQRFRVLEQQYTAGQITLDQYRIGLLECRVTDAYGRTWMPQERTGEWYVLMNGQWVPGKTLPPQAAMPVMPPSQFAPLYTAQAQPVAHPSEQAVAQAKGGTKLGVSLIIWFIIFVVIAVIIGIITKGAEPLIFVGIGVAALISLIIILVNAGSAWEGQIVDIRTHTEHYYDSDGDRRTRRVTYAYLRQPNGNTKRIHCGLGYQVGDYVVKRKGETTPRLVKHS